MAEAGSDDTELKGLPLWLVVFALALTVVLITLAGGWVVHATLVLVNADIAFWPCTAVVAVVETSAFLALRHAADNTK